MADGITHNNKDVMFKVLSQYYGNKSFAVYGLDIPRVKRLLPSDYPTVTASEIYGDNVFELVDESLFMLEYESSPKVTDFLKYIKYATHALERSYNNDSKMRNIIIGVVYTGDIESTPAKFDVGALQIQIQQVFLSHFDTNELYVELKAMIESGEPLIDDEIMKFIILPLTQPSKPLKQKLIEDTIDLAKQIQDESQQLFVMAGILTATDKFIDRAYSEMVKGWIKMTKVARLFEEEKVEAVNEARKQELTRVALEMLADGDDVLRIMRLTKFTRDEINQLRQGISA